MKTEIRYWMLGILSLSLCTGCAQRHYDRVEPGELHGKLIVEWMEPDRFLFRPDQQNPLTFERQSGQVITPQAMVTDGGSIPRPLWVLRNYSPWGYGPAFIVHDWLFYQQDCQLPGADEWTLEEAALVMSEVMKTMMESPDFDYGDKFTVYSMYKAVQTPPARAAWNDHECPEFDPQADWQPSVRFVVSFGD